MAKANYVPTVFSAVLTGVKRNASRKPRVRYLTGLAPPSSQSDTPGYNIGPSRGASCRDVVRRVP
jgi:hypothetical protein